MDDNIMISNKYSRVKSYSKNMSIFEQHLNVMISKIIIFFILTYGNYYLISIL